MKKSKENIEQEINLAMNSFEGMERAKASPFLYEKVMTRVNESKNSSSAVAGWSFSLNVKYALALIVFIMLNIFTITEFSGEKSVNNNNLANTKQEDSKTKFVKEYFYNSSNSYGY